MDNHNLNTVIDEIISDLGYYSPIELLLRQGRLRFSDYEDWRYGKTELLTEQLMGSAKRVNSLLESAHDYALKLGLTAEAAEFYGWKGDKANQSLKLGNSLSDFDLSLLSSQYKRQQNIPQLDLFFDNQGVQIANELAQAIAGRNIELAELKLNQLERIDPGHALCGQAVILINALRQLDDATQTLQAAQQLDHIQNHLLPLAKDILKGGTRDFIAPFWRQLALNIDSEAYSDQHPELHPAYCYSQILLWQEAIDSILQNSNWHQFPALYKMLSQAFYQNNQRNESIQVACEFCWLFKDQQPDFLLDAHCSTLYLQFMDLELDEHWGWTHFPSWILIHEPGLASHLSTPLSKAQPQPPETFSLLMKLLESPQNGSHQDMALRSSLKQAHDEIFGYFLGKFSRL